MSWPLHRGLQIGVPSLNHSKEFAQCGFPSELPSPSGASRSRQSRTLCSLKLSLAVIMLFALLVSLYWTVAISSFSRDNIYLGYRRLQKQLVADLTDIGELSSGVSRLSEVEFCPPEYENYVPCYQNFSDPDVGVEYERRCVLGSGRDLGCLILLPRDYRIPLRWPGGRDFIWKENVKISMNEFSSGSLTKRMMVEEEQISFRSDSLMVDGVEDYIYQIAEMIGLRNESDFNKAGVRTVLDIGCGFGSFGAHLFSKQLLTMCIASYEASGSQVQVTLERGIPAMIGSFVSTQLPFPNLSFDMLHCASCGIEWEKNDGIFMVEIDRLLKPGGYFIWTSPSISQRLLHDEISQKKWSFIHDFGEKLCWDLLLQQDETVLWKKTSTKKCYSTRKSGPAICGKNHEVDFLNYQPLNLCIGETRSERWIPIHDRKPWPSRADLDSAELSVYGLQHEEFAEDSMNWNSAICNYWSLLSPLIFSDHPKRPGDEDPSPPFNMLRNVMDMNAHLGGFNIALLEARKSVWVMNVVPTDGPNHLPLILDRGLIAVYHDWCEAFPTYPRTYDMVHAAGLLSLENLQPPKCSMLDIFLEIDRLLRPEGWVIVRDSTSLIKAARFVANQLKWDARIVELEGNNSEKLLVCQKSFFRRQLK